MKFSTKTTYGLRALHYISQNSGNISLAQIAKKELISLPYLERIFASLKKAGLVQSVQGAKGGYRLKRPLASISLLTVVNALEGPINMFYCLDDKQKKKCRASCHCEINKHLKTAQIEIVKSLARIKLHV